MSDLSNKYMYPNPNSYRGMGQKGVLAKGYLFPMTVKRPVDTTTTTDGAGGATDGSDNVDETPTNTVTTVSDAAGASVPRGAVAVEESADGGNGRYMLGYYGSPFNYDSVETVRGQGGSTDPTLNAVAEEVSIGFPPGVDRPRAWYRFTLLDAASSYEGLIYHDGHFESWAYHVSQIHTAPRTRAGSGSSTNPSAPGVGNWFANLLPWMPQGSSQRASAVSARQVTREIDYSKGKQFQFNPASLGMNIEMDSAGVADAATEAQGGNYQGGSIGFASSSIKLMFDRTQEVYAATMGKDGVDPIFKDIGVQKDIFDVLRIILGDAIYDDATDNAIGTVDNVTNGGSGGVRRQSATAIAERLFDIGATGHKAYSSPVAIVFNRNLAINALVTGLSFSYAQFNHLLVPTLAAMDLSFSIVNTSSVSGLNSLLNSSLTALDTTALPGSSQTPSVPSASGTNRPRPTPIGVNRAV